MAQQMARNVKSAQRVLEILEYFDLNRREATVMELARSLNYPQSSTTELLQSMARMGYLEFDRFKRAYSPTARVAVLGAWVDPMMIKGGPALSLAEALSKELDETVALSIAKNFSVMHVHVTHGECAHAESVRIGGTMSLVQSVPGKVMLTSFRNDQIQRIVRRINAETSDPELCVRLPDIVADADAVRAQGWLSGRDEDGLLMLSILLPSWPGMDRLVLTVFLEQSTDEMRCDEVAKLLEARVASYLKQSCREAEFHNDADRHDNVHYLRTA